MSSDPLTELSDQDRARLEVLLVDFDLGWTPDRLTAAVAGLPPAGAFRTAALREMVKIDLERHARRGIPVPLRHYLDRFPELADSGVASTDLRDAEAASHDTVRPPAEPGSIEPPREFGRYRIFRPLGKGGMGGVYLARDNELDRLVALKVPRFAPDDATAVERFTREARAAATIDHPNVCRVYDVGRIDGLPYISMAYVEGPTLADVLRDGPLPPRRAAELARDVARALAEAHRRGVVHRDLKPANILMSGVRSQESGVSKDKALTPDSCLLTPVVTDFGLAARTAPDDPRLTAEGVVAGTPPYMSPEQVSGERAGPPSDVYSLGAVLYEMATGQPPFGGSRTDIFVQVLSASPTPPSRVRAGIDSGLDAITLKALAKRPWDRFTGMAEFADALDQWLAGVRDQAPARRRLAVGIGLGVAAVAVLVGLVVVLTRQWADKSAGTPPPPSGEPTTVALAPTTAVTATTVRPDPGRTTITPAASPIRTAMTTPGSTTRTRIQIKPTFPRHYKPRAAFDVTLEDPGERIVAVAFSPNGKQVYAATVSAAGLGIRRWDVATRREVTSRVRRERYTWAMFSADGRQYLAGGIPGLTDLRQSESGKLDKQFRTEPRAATGAISRDGKRVVVAVNSQQARRARVYDVATEQPLGEFRGHEKDVRCVAVADDGKYVYSASPDRHAVWDAETGKASTEAGDNKVVCAAFLLKDPRVAFAYQTGGIGSINLKVGVQFGDFEDRHQGAITALAQAPEFILMVSAGADKSLRGWLPTRGTHRWELTDLAEVQTAIGFSVESRRWLVTASARTWTVWDLSEK